MTSSQKTEARRGGSSENSSEGFFVSLKILRRATLQSKKNIHADRSKNLDVRIAAMKALLQLLEPLAGFVLDSGLSTNEMHVLFREATVRSAAEKQLQISNRINISGIAAATGISRSDISRILKVRNIDAPRDVPKFSDSQATNRMLAAWHEDPRFTDPDGYPSELSMYGRGITFDALTKRYGLGIPTRAVLDELIRAGAVELISNQRIRAKTSVAVGKGMTARVIKTFGDRASELLSAMLINMREPETPKFIANVSDSSIPGRLLPLLREEISVKSAAFLADVQENLKRNSVPNRVRAKKRDVARISVTIFYHESDASRVKRIIANNGPSRRRNFRRET